MLARLSLRARLMLGVIALASRRARRRRLRDLRGAALVPDRPHRQLARRGHIAAEGALRARQPAAPATVGEPDGPRRSTSRSRQSPGDYVELRTLDGTVVAQALAPQFPGDAECAAAAASPTRSTLDRRDRAATASATSPSRRRSGGGRYRVRASIEPQRDDYVADRRAPLDDVNSTLHRLLLIELLVTVAVLAASPLLGLWVVRLGLRPLDGDRSHRGRDRRRRPDAPRRARRRRAPRSAGSGSR